MTSVDVAIQLIGAAGLLFGVFSFQAKRRKNILLTQLLSNAFWMLHFYVLGAFTGAALNGVGGFRAIIFKKYSSKQRPSWILVGVISLVIGAGLLTWQSWVSALPMTAMTIATIGFWQRDEQRIRLMLLFASPLWLVYSYVSGSYAGMCTELLAITSISIALWRYRRKRLSLLAVQKTS